MKYTIFCLFIISGFISCQKELNNENQTPDGNYDNCRLVKTVQGTGTDDTTFLYTYDNEGRLEYILDQRGNPDTLSAVFSNGALRRIKQSNSDLALIRYTSSGKPAELENNFLKFSAEYNDDDVLTKVSDYSIDGNTTVLYRYYTFDYNNEGDIIKVHHFTPAGAETHFESITYTNIENPFKNLTFFNFQNWLGMIDVMPLGYYLFSPSKLVESVVTGDSRYDISYEFENYKIVTSRAKWIDGGTARGTFTRKYFYECF